MVSHLKRFELYLRLSAFVLPTIALLLALTVVSSEPLDVRKSAEMCGLLTLLWLLACNRYRLLSLDELFRRRHFSTDTACMATFSILALILFLLEFSFLAPIALVLCAALLFALTTLTRLALRMMIYWMPCNSESRVLVVGADYFAHRAVRKLRNSRLGNCVPVAYVRMPNQRVADVKSTVYEFDQLNQVDASDIDEILIAVPLEFSGSVRTITSELERFCKPVHAVMDLGPRFFIDKTLYQIGRLQLVHMVTRPSELWQYRVAKRAVDILLSSLLLLILLPLLFLIAVGLKLSSPGPVLFSHTRRGFRGKAFKVWKFRTMVMNGEEVLQDAFRRDPALAEEWRLNHKLRNDPRITAIGSLLRRTSMDELPQLINVVCGEMSLVGPRPIVDAEIPRYGSLYPLYTRVLPGITGLWQVSGRSDTNYEQRVQLDARYVREWTPWLDLRVLARTVIVVFGGDGAY